LTFDPLARRQSRPAAGLGLPEHPTSTGHCCHGPTGVHLPASTFMWQTSTIAEKGFLPVSLSRRAYRYRRTHCYTCVYRNRHVSLYTHLYMHAPGVLEPLHLFCALLSPRKGST